MQKTDRMRALETAYGRDIFALLRDKYEHGDYTQHELAAELSEHIDDEIPRSTLQNWLREAGVELQRRALSDVQRITIMALLPYFTNYRIAERVGCGKRTVARYRQEVRRTETPVTLSENVELTARDYNVLVPHADGPPSNDEPASDTESRAISSESSGESA